MSLWLIKRLKSQLNLSIEPGDWLAEQNHLDTEQFIINLLQNVVLAEVQGPIVIFVDQINNTTVSLDFFDKLFNAIKFIHNARANDSVYNRLTFVVLGVVTLADLTTGRSQLSENFAQLIDLCEFSREETQVFQQGLQATYPEQG